MPYITPEKYSGAIDCSRSSKAEFNRASAGILTNEPSRASSMVKESQPKPVLRPAPHIANGPDRTAFNQAWRHEQQQALAEQPQPYGKPSTVEKMVQKAIILARAEKHSQTRSQTRNR